MNYIDEKKNKIKKDALKEMKIFLLISNICFFIINFFVAYSQSREYSLLDLFTNIIVLIIWSIIIIFSYWLHIKRKFNLIDNRKNILLNRKMYKEDAVSNGIVYIEENDYSFLKKMLNRVRRLNYFDAIIVAISLFFLIYYSIIFIKNDKPEYFVFAIITFFLIIFFGMVLTQGKKMSYSTIINEFSHTALVKTDTRLIIVKAKSMIESNPKIYNKNASVALDYTVATSASTGLLQTIAGFHYGNKLLEKITADEKYDKEVLQRLTSKDEVLNIIKENNQKYYINVYNNVKLVREKKDYYICSGLNNNNSTVSFKIYKAYNGIDMLFDKNA